VLAAAEVPERHKKVESSEKARLRPCSKSLRAQVLLTAVAVKDKQGETSKREVLLRSACHLFVQREVASGQHIKGSHKREHLRSAVLEILV
jgi:hypothetical protein